MEEEKQFGMNDLDEDVLSMVLNQMIVTNQIAVSRVAKRFDGAALKLVQSFRPEAEQVPSSKWLELVKRMPELKALTLPKPERPAQSELVHNILKTIVSSKRVLYKLPNVDRIVSNMYLKIAICSDPNYDGSNFKEVLKELDYNRMKKKYSNVKLRFTISMFASEFNPTTRSDYERLTDPNLAALIFEQGELPFDFKWTLSLARHITKLTINVPSDGDIEMPDFGSAAQLESLKHFNISDPDLEYSPEVGTSGNKWKEQDFDSFKKMLENPTLVEILLDIYMSQEQYTEALAIFLKCPRNNFKVFFLPGEFKDGNNNENDSPLSLSHGKKASMALEFHFAYGIGMDFPLVEFMKKFRPKYRKFELKSQESLKIACNMVKDLVIREPKFTFSFLLQTESGLIPEVYKIIRPIDIVIINQLMETTINIICIQIESGEQKERMYLNTDLSYNCSLFY